MSAGAPIKKGTATSCTLKSPTHQIGTIVRVLIAVFGSKLNQIIYFRTLQSKVFCLNWSPKINNGKPVDIETKKFQIITKKLYFCLPICLLLIENKVATLTKSFLFVFWRNL